MLRIERRIIVTRAVKLIYCILSLLVAFLIGALLFVSAKVNPLSAYGTIISASFGSFKGFSEVIVRAIPLILCGTGVAFAARMLLWNIGCEGQLVMGGVSAAGVALFISPFIPEFLVIPTMILAGFLGGGLWALIPGILKSFWKVNEILTSLMLNYVAIFWFEHLYYGPWRDPEGRGFPGTAIFPQAAHLPRYLGTRIHPGIFFAILAVILVYFIFSFTRWGYEIKVTGENPEAARYAGININRNIGQVMFLSGALAGLAGMAQTGGVFFRLQHGLAAGYGYTGILVAFLSGLNPFLVILVSILFGALFVGGDHLQMSFHIPASIGDVLQASILFCFLGGTALMRYRIKLEKRKNVEDS